MKSPFTGKLMTLQREARTLKFRKEDFNYCHHNYYCKDTNQFFTSTELDEINLNQVYNQYRDKYNIPFSDEIRELRDKLSISAVKMSKILGFGTNGYSNYEKGEVPSISNANLIKTIIRNKENLKTFIEDYNCPSDEKLKLINKVDVLIKEENAYNFQHGYFMSLFGDNLLPDVFTGYRKLNFEKFHQMVVFFADRVTPTITKMNKLLFYADFLNYKKTGYSISGMKYKAIPYGPVPVRYRSLFDHLEHQQIIKLVRFNAGGYSGEDIHSEVQFDKEYFDEVELNSMIDVVRKFKGCSATEISDLSHREKAWIDNNKEKMEIDYNYSFDFVTI